MQIVTAHRLKQWAEGLPLDAQADLPELVRSLIQASCPDLEYYRFPGGHASQTHGWDGVTQLKKDVLFVPEGAQSGNSALEQTTRRRSTATTPNELRN